MIEFYGVFLVLFLYLNTHYYIAHGGWQFGSHLSEAGAGFLFSGRGDPHCTTTRTVFSTLADVSQESKKNASRGTRRVSRSQVLLIKRT